jgi:hypothetical protein
MSVRKLIRRVAPWLALSTGAACSLVIPIDEKPKNPIARTDSGITGTGSSDSAVSLTDADAAPTPSPCAQAQAHDFCDDFDRANWSFSRDWPPLPNSDGGVFERQTLRFQTAPAALINRVSPGATPANVTHRMNQDGVLAGTSITVELDVFFDIAPSAPHNLIKINYAEHTTALRLGPTGVLWFRERTNDNLPSTDMSKATNVSLKAGQWNHIVFTIAPYQGQSELRASAEVIGATPPNQTFTLDSTWPALADPYITIGYLSGAEAQTIESTIYYDNVVADVK